MPAKQKINGIPKLGDVGDDVLTLQCALIAHGFEPGNPDSEFGPKTASAVVKCQQDHGLPGSGVIGPVTLGLLDLEVEVTKNEAGELPAWYIEAKKFEGKVETDSKFQEFMNTQWKKIGLPGFKGLVGSKRAWCALFVFMAIGATGYETGKLNASAVSADHLGQRIDWKTQGIPRGAVVRINHGSDCGVWENSHVSFANGSCSPQDLAKPGASINLFGGNQGNMVKVSSFPVNDICTVSWPKDAPLPAKVTKSNGCSGSSKPSNESTK